VKLHFVTESYQVKRCELIVDKSQVRDVMAGVLASKAAVVGVADKSIKGVLPFSGTRA